MVKPKILTLYETALAQTTTEKRTTQKTLRCSSLPPCFVSYLLDKDKPKESNVLGNYYTSVGTILHGLIQNSISKTVADWQCTKCKAEYELKVKPSKCTECSSRSFSHSEIELTYKNIEGHIDLIFLLNKQYHLVDIKTTSMASLPTVVKTPPASYRTQVTSYACLLYKTREIKVNTISILYVPRDNPSAANLWTLPFTKDVYKQGMLNLEKWNETFERIKHKEKNIEIVLCKNVFCKYCMNSIAELQSALNSKYGKNSFEVQK